VRRDNLNLAQKPFANYRPVARVTSILWVLGALLFVANFAFYWGFYSSQGETRGTLAEIQEASGRESARIDELERSIAGHDLESQNAQALFLNDRIRERTFGWSALFDTLADILPRDVRLERLAPDTQGDRQTSRRRGSVVVKEAPATQPVALAIRARARNHEAFLEFLDALTGSPAFRSVNPRGESREQGDQVSFVLDTQYLPRQAPAQLAPVLEESLDGGELLPATEDDSEDGAEETLAAPAGARRGPGGSTGTASDAPRLVPPRQTGTPSPPTAFDDEEET
jgi:Tfp pilus assembly protein PilN